MRLPWIIIIVIATLLCSSFFVQAQNWEDAPPTTQNWEDEIPPSRFRCASADEDIFREPSRTGHGVDQTLVDILDGIGYFLMLLGWLFAAGLLRLIIRLLRKRFAVWIVMWLPLCLIALVAYAPLQKYWQLIHELEAFQRECRPFQSPSAAFQAFQARILGDVLPYISMLLGIMFLYIPAIRHVIRFQGNKDVEPNSLQRSL